MSKSTKTRPAYAHEERTAAHTVTSRLPKKKRGKQGKKQSRGK